MECSPVYIYTCTCRFPQASLSTPTWLDNVRCSGNERRLASCSHNGYGNEDCSHSEDIALDCSSSMEPTDCKQTMSYMNHA